MKFILRLFVSVAIFIFPIFCQSQTVTKYDKKFNKLLSKAEDKFFDGDIAKARKYISKVREKSIQKLGKNNKFLASAVVRESYYDFFMGNIRNLDKDLKEAISISKSVEGDGSVSHAELLLEISKIYSEYGNYLKANDYLEEVNEIYTSGLGLFTEERKVAYDYQKALILAGRGFYREALEMIESSLGFFKPKVYILEKDEAEKMARKVANLMITRADVMGKMGDNQAADAAFIENDTWIKKYISKNDILDYKNQFYNLRMLDKGGLSDDAAAKMYRKLYYGMAARYPGHYLTIEMRERLIKSYWTTENPADIKKQEKEYRQAIRKTYDRESIYRIYPDLLDYESNLRKPQDVESELYEFISDESVIPIYHPIKIKSLNFLVRLARLNGNPQNASKYLNEIMQIQKQLVGVDAPIYHLAKIKLANHLFTYSDDFERIRKIYEESFINVVEPEINYGHEDYIDISNNIAAFSKETDDFESANARLKKSLLAARKKFDNQDPDYANVLSNVADLQIEMGRYKEAQENIEEAYSILDNSDLAIVYSYLSKLAVIDAKLLLEKGEYDLAEDNIESSQEARQKIVLNTSEDIDTDDLANIYLKVGSYQSAKEILNESIEEYKFLYGDNSRRLIKPNLLLAEYYLITGDYTEAETLSRNTESLIIKLYGEQSTKLLDYLLLISRIYSTLGDYERSIEYLEQAKNIIQEKFGAQNVKMAKVINQLALTKFYNGDPLSETESLLNQAEKLIGNELGVKIPAYAEILKNKAIVYIAADQFAAATNYLDLAGSIWSDKIGKRNNINAATVSMLKGDIFYEQRQYNRADNYYEASKKRYEKMFNDTHPEYVKVLSRLSKTYFMKGNRSKAKKSIEEVLDNYHGFIKNYFPSLSEREKTKFWNTIKPDFEFYNSMIIDDYSSNSKMIAEMYNNALVTKALLLNSTLKIRERILNSTDYRLKSLFSEWIRKKERLTNALSMTVEQLEENNIKTSKLEEEVEDIERQLSEVSSDFNQTYDNEIITWQQIQRSLKENEVAMEILRVRHFDHTFTDSVIYAVLYLKADKGNEPSLLVISNGKTLEDKYLKYYQNSVKYQLEDKYSKEYFWDPIAKAAGKLSTIYFSPDGVFNQINLEAIPTGDGKYVIDNSNIILVNNTKDIYLNKVKTDLVTEEKVAYMFGDPLFYIDTEPGDPAPNSGLDREQAEVIQRLPGTNKEVLDLRSYLSENGWKTVDYTEYKAQEDSVKELQSPKIFHIATHGFFKPSPDLLASNLELNENNAYQNPLLRSGLLLTGAGDILNETKFNYNVHPGILTAYEAMNLNLDKTDLVVLSACETGLGEITSGEGVYGLQRAFLVAGARSIIMSLFKVSDQATQELMGKFYRYWLDSGDKRDAFIKAKKEIRTEYPDPIYWGAFVMIGLD